MSTLEQYILDKYSRWVDFDICTDELTFDIGLALDALVVKKCTGGSISALNKNGVVSGGYMTPKMRPSTYTKNNFCIPHEHIDYVGDRLLFSELAKLLNLNLHFDGSE